MKCLSLILICILGDVVCVFGQFQQQKESLKNHSAKNTPISFSHTIHHQRHTTSKMDSIFVESSVNSQLIYNDELILVIRGYGFDPDNNYLSFTNTQIGQYETVSTATSVTLRLNGGFWCNNRIGYPVSTFPSPLTLMAIRPGNGNYVNFGPIGSDLRYTGIQVAMIYERPVITHSDKTLFRSQSSTLLIKGKGFPFPTSQFQNPLLKFDPPLTLGLDYTVNVTSRTELAISLLEGRAWRSFRGPLRLMAINSRGDASGWVELAGGDGVQVADVLEVVIYPSTDKVYQSIRQQSITVRGSGFRQGMSFAFEPAMRVEKDYKLVVVSNQQVILNPVPKSKWPFLSQHTYSGSPLLLKNVTFDGTTFCFTNGTDVQVATILANPHVNKSTIAVYDSQTRVVTIRGSGFTNAVGTKVVLTPTHSRDFKVIGVLEDSIRILLKANRTWSGGVGGLWLPQTLSIQFIDTGAGVVSTSVNAMPTVIATIIRDRREMICDDSCKYALDGSCDDLNSDYHQGRRRLPDVPNDDYQVSLCAQNTDCTDCGGVKTTYHPTAAPYLITHSPTAIRPSPLPSVSRNPVTICPSMLPRSYPTKRPTGVPFVTPFVNSIADLTDMTKYNSFLAAHEYTCIYFHIPDAFWFNMYLPVYEQLSDNVYNEHIPVGFTKVDCTVHKTLCYGSNVASSHTETLRCFHNGGLTTAVSDYSGSNTLTGLKGYVLTCLKAYGYVDIRTQSPTPTPSANDGYFTSAVTTLDSSTFESFLNSHDYVLVHFQTPLPAWSSRLGDVLNQLVYLLQTARVSVSIARILCVSSPLMCSNTEASTLRFYANGVSQPVIDIYPYETQQMTALDLFDFIQERVKSHTIIPLIPEKGGEDDTVKQNNNKTHGLSDGGVLLIVLVVLLFLIVGGLLYRYREKLFRVNGGAQYAAVQLSEFELPTNFKGIAPFEVDE